MNDKSTSSKKEIVNNGLLQTISKEKDHVLNAGQKNQSVAQVMKDKNYGKSKGLYSEKMLKKTLRQHFITIPQAELCHQQLIDNLKQVSKNLKYVCVGKEQHASEGEHYHILLTGTNPIGIGAIHKRIMMTEGNIGGAINYQKVETANAVETYCKKDGNYKEHGSIATQRYNKEKQGNEIDADLNELYTNDKTYDENIIHIKAKQPSYYTQYGTNIEKELKKKDVKPLKKWEAPVYNTENSTLRPYQQRIWDIINTQPKNRQIIWVCGRPNTGKSFMFNYIDENYDYGIYSAGSTASLDNAVYGYEEQGAIAWDIPLNYDFNNFGDALASTIEKFSDYGQYLTSRKYQGKKIQVLGHVIVFSNRRVLPQLKHRDIIEINTRDDESEAEKLSTWGFKTTLKKDGKKIWEQTIEQHGEEPIRKYYYSMNDLPHEIKQDVYD